MIQRDPILEAMTGPEPAPYQPPTLLERIRANAQPTGPTLLERVKAKARPKPMEYVEEAGGSLASSALEGFAGLVEAPSRVRREVMGETIGSVRKADTTLGEAAGEWLRRQSQGLRNEIVENSQPEGAAGKAAKFLSRDVAGAVGSTIPAATGGVLAAAAGIPPWIGVAASGAATNGAAAAYEAQYMGATPEQQWTAFWTNAAVGTTEAVPVAGQVGRILGRADKLSGGWLRKALIEGGEELAQETVQQTAGNWIAQAVAGYDQDRKLLEGVAESGGAGGLSGMILSALSGVRVAGSRNTQRNATPTDSAIFTEEPTTDLSKPGSVSGSQPFGNSEGLNLTGVQSEPLGDKLAKLPTTGAAPLPVTSPSGDAGAAATIAELSDANGQPVRAVEGPNTPEAQYVREFATQRGLKVQFVEGANEVHGASTPGTIYVDVKAPLRSVAYHETVHQLGAEAQTLADDLRALDPEGAAKYEQFYAREYERATGAPYDAGKLGEEGVAYRAELNAGLVYEALQRPERLRAILEGKPGAWTRIVDAIVRAFQKVGVGVRTSKQRALDALRREVAGQDASRALDSETAVRVALRIRDAFESLQANVPNVAPNVAQEAANAGEPVQPQAVEPAPDAGSRREQTPAASPRIVVAEMPKGAQLGTDLTGEPVYSKVERGDVARPGAGIPQPKVAQPGIFDEVGGLFEKQAYGTEEAAKPKAADVARDRAKSKGRLKAFVRAIGGIKADAHEGGELHSVFKNKEAGTGSFGLGPIVHGPKSTKGVHWEAAMREAVDAGFFPGRSYGDMTYAEFFDALDNDVARPMDVSAEQEAERQPANYEEAEREAIYNESFLPPSKKVKGVPFSIRPRSLRPDQIASREHVMARDDVHSAIRERMGDVSDEAVGRVVGYIDDARRGLPNTNTKAVAERALSLWKQDYDEMRGESREAVEVQEDQDIGQALADMVRGHGDIEVQEIVRTIAQQRQPTKRGERLPDVGNVRAKFSVAPRTDSPEFREWFGESKVTDKNGKPLVVYHGTMQEFVSFMSDKLGSNTGAKNTKLGFFFSSSSSVASTFGDRVIPAYLSIKNPLAVGFEKGRYNKRDRSGEIADGYGPVKDAITKSSGRSSWEDVTAEDVANWVALVESNGFDGLSIYTSTDSAELERYGEAATGRGLYRPAPHTMWVAFRPAQIKSATGNRGTFDPKNPDIRFSVAPKGSFDIPDDNKREYVKRSLSDIFRPLVRAEKAAPNKVRGGESIESAIRRRPGLVSADTDRVRRQFLDPARALGLDSQKADDFLTALHAPTRNALVSKRSGGKRGTESNPGAGMRNSEAAKIVSDALAGPDAAKYRELQRLNRKLNETRLDALESGGLLDDETRAKWEAEFGPDYVPLKTVEDDAETRLGSTGFNVRGPEARRAEGRSSRADNPYIVNILQTYEAIDRKHRNRVGNLVADMVAQNPSAEWGIAEQRPAEGHALSYKENGQQKFITTTRDDLASAFSALDVAKAGPILQIARKAQSYLRAVITSNNPVFPFYNVPKDIGTAALKGYLRKDAKFGARIAKNYINATRGAIGKRPEKWIKMAQRAKDAGALTSFANLESFGEMVDGWNKLDEQGRFRRVWNALGKLNEYTEAGTRIATFEAAVNSGMSDAEAANMARDITVDFSRKGNWSSNASIVYLFFNANVQGTASIFRAMKDRPAQAGKLAAMMVTAGFLSSLASRLMAGDDDNGENKWDMMPESQKQRMFGVMIDGRTYGVPAPWGFNVLWYAGARMEAALNGRTRTNGAADMLSASLQAFSPLQGANLTQAATPTLGRPFVEIGQNQDFAGRSIRPEPSPYDRTPLPRSQQAFASVNPALKAGAEGLNRLTGGDSVRPGMIDVSPEDIEHFLKFLGGGIGANAERFASGVQRMAQGDTPRISDWPAVRAYVAELPESATARLYYDNIKNIELEVEARKAGETSDPAIAGLSTLAKSVDARVRRLRDQKKKSDPSQAAEWDARIRSAMAVLNRRLVTQ